MTLSQTLKISWEGLTLNKVRSFLTTLGVIIGVGAVIVMLAISAGAEAEIADQINSLGANLIMVMPSFSRGGFGPGSRPPSLSYEDLPVIAGSISGISGVSAEQNTTQDVKAGSVTIEDVSLVGTTSGFTAVREYLVAEGRFVTDEDTDRTSKVAVLGYDLAVELFGDPASAVGQSIKAGSVKLTVVGVMEDKGVVGNTDYDSRVYVTITVVFDKFSGPQRFGGGGVRMLYVSAESRNVMEQVMSDVTSVLVREHRVDPAEPDFQLITQDSIISGQKNNDPDVGETPLIEEYVFMHTLRGSMNGSWGEPVVEGDQIEVGVTYEKSYSIIFPQDWVPKDCHVVAFIFERNNRTVIQAEEGSVLK